MTSLPIHTARARHLARQQILALVLSVGAGACGSSLSPPAGSGGSAGSGSGGNATGGAVGAAGDAAGGAAGSDTSICQSLQCGDSGRLCNAVTAKCVFYLADADCLTGMFNTHNPNAVCLPDGTCGCTADSNCVGQLNGTRCIPSRQQCGCESNADCPTGGTIPTPACETNTGACVQCVTDADCTDPNNRVCDATMHACRPCRVSADCAQSADGPSCQDVGPLDGIGTCGCNTDQDCVGHAGGPHCVSDGISSYLKCGA